MWAPVSDQTSFGNYADERTNTYTYTYTRKHDEAMAPFNAVCLVSNKICRRMPLQMINHLEFIFDVLNQINKKCKLLKLCTNTLLF